MFVLNCAAAVQSSPKDLDFAVLPIDWGEKPPPCSCAVSNYGSLELDSDELALHEGMPEALTSPFEPHEEERNFHRGPCASPANC